MSVDCVPFNPASALPAEPPMFSFLYSEKTAIGVHAVIL